MITASLPRELRTRHGLQAIVAAFGVFDGVHRGHLEVLRRVVQRARDCRAAPVVITFDTHPRAVVATDLAPPPLLCTLPQRLRLLAAAGMEAAVLLPFDQAMAAMPAEDFLRRLVFASDGPRVLGVCIGSTWRFGRGGAGTVDTLKQVAATQGCDVDSVQEVLIDGRTISSTRIREAIQNGRLEAAAAWLGRPFAVAGIVQHGRGVGGPALGCPTANIQDADLVMPPDGVYAARARLISRGDSADGIAYVGQAPTFTRPGEPPPPRLVELHLLDRTETLYGHEIEVEFVRFLRPDQRFASPAALKQQIAVDIAAARRCLEQTPEAPAAPGPQD